MAGPFFVGGNIPLLRSPNSVRNLLSHRHTVRGQIVW